MDDARNEINREHLLKLGGMGALAAVSALLADPNAAGAAENENKKRPVKSKKKRYISSNPISLDWTATEPGTAHLGDCKPVHRVLVTSTLADTNSPRKADLVYCLGKPEYRGKDTDGHDENDDMDYLLYVAVWTKK